MTARIVILSRGDGEGSQASQPEILRCAQDDGESLPKHAHTHLDLARITGAALHGAVEVEDEVRHLGAPEILAVENIEDVDSRLGDDATDVELLREAQVERRIFIVLAAEVA